MKKFQSMMLMLLVAVMGMAVQSCGSDEETTTVTYTYSRKPLNNLTYNGKVLTSYTEAEVQADAVLTSFGLALVEADQSLQNQSYVSESSIMSIYRNALSPFTSGKGFEGYVLLVKQRTGGNEEELGRITFTK